MSMRFRRGAIRARDIDGEPAAVKLQVRIRGFVSVVPAVPRLKTRPTFVRCFINSHFFRDRWTLNAARENPVVLPMYPRFIYPVEKFQSIVLRTRHLQRVSDFCNEYYISLILWFFFALEFISINLNSSFIFFSNYSDGIWSSGEKRASEWFVEKRKEEATSRFPTSSVYRYKFLFFGTEVCQARTGAIRISLLQSCHGEI